MKQQRTEEELDQMVSRTYAIRLDRRNPDERSVREQVDAWLKEAKAQGEQKAMRTIFIRLVKAWTGEQVSPPTISFQAFEKMADTIAARVEAAVGERLEAAVRSTIRDIAASNPQALIQIAERASDGEEIDDIEMDNILGVVSGKNRTKRSMF